MFVRDLANQKKFVAGDQSIFKEKIDSEKIIKEFRDLRAKIKDKLTGAEVNEIVHKTRQAKTGRFEIRQKLKRREMSVFEKRVKMLLGRTVSPKQLMEKARKII